MTWNPFKLRARVADLENSLRFQVGHSERWANRAVAAEVKLERCQHNEYRLEMAMEAIQFQRLNALAKANAVNAARHAEKKERERVVGETAGALTCEGGLE